MLLEIFVLILVSITHPCLEMLDVGFSDFWISGESFIKKNCHNFRTSNDIDMKLGLVTKLDKKSTNNIKKVGQ